MGHVKSAAGFCAVPLVWAVLPDGGNCTVVYAVGAVQGSKMGYPWLALRFVPYPITVSGLRFRALVTLTVFFQLQHIHGDCFLAIPASSACPIRSPLIGCSPLYKTGKFFGKNFLSVCGPIRGRYILPPGLAAELGFKLLINVIINELSIYRRCLNRFGYRLCPLLHRDIASTSPNYCLLSRAVNTFQSTTTRSRKKTRSISVMGSFLQEMCFSSSFASTEG